MKTATIIDTGDKPVKREWIRLWINGRLIDRFPYTVGNWEERGKAREAAMDTLRNYTAKLEPSPGPADPIDPAVWQSIDEDDLVAHVGPYTLRAEEMSHGNWWWAVSTWEDHGRHEVDSGGAANRALAMEAAEKAYKIHRGQNG